MGKSREGAHRSAQEKLNRDDPERTTEDLEMVRTKSLPVLVFLSCLGLCVVVVKSYAYVEAPQSLGSVVQQSTNIMVCVVEKVDKEKNLIVYRKVEDLKGKHPTETIKHNIARAGYHPREWQYVMEWAEVGKAAIFFP